MPARRCSKCDVNYPSDKKLCPIHQEPTWMMGKEDPHDTDWAEQVSRWQQRVLPGERIPNLSITMLKKSDQLFVAHDLLKAGGYISCEVGSVVYLNDSYYELNGLVYKDTEAEGWWIEAIDPEGVLDNATPQDFENQD